MCLNEMERNQQHRMEFAEKKTRENNFKKQIEINRVQEESGKRKIGAPEMK